MVQSEDRIAKWIRKQDYKRFISEQKAQKLKVKDYKKIFHTQGYLKKLG